MCSLTYLFSLFRGDTHAFGYQKPVVNQLFMIYCFLGGMYFENRVPWKIRYFWVWLNSALIAAITVSNIHALKTGNFEFGILLSLILSNCMSISAAFGVPLIMYYFRKPIHFFLAVIDSHINTDGEVMKPPNYSSGKFNVVLWAVTAVGVVIIFVYAGCAPLDLALFYDEKKLQNPYQHIYYSPLIRSCTSPVAYAIVFATEMINMIPCMPLIALYPMCMILIATKIRSYFFELGNQLQSIFRGSMGNTHSPSRQVEGTVADIWSDVSKGRWRDVECEYYIRELMKCARRYWKLVR